MMYYEYYVNFFQLLMKNYENYVNFCQFPSHRDAIFFQLLFF